MSAPIRIVVTPRLVERVRILAEGYARSTGADPPAFYLDYYLNLRPHLAVVGQVAAALAIAPGHEVVEIGSGLGTRCLLGTALTGARFTGVEPCRNTYEPLAEAIAELADANPAHAYRRVSAPGEATGLATGSADFVLSSEVLEHVAEPERVIAEIHRLLRPGGRAWLSTASYRSFYEGHFRSPWLPFLGRRSGRWWVGLLGRNPAFLDEINFITRRRLLDAVRRAGFREVELGERATPVLLPPLEVVYPEGFDPIQRDRRRSRAQELANDPRVTRLLRPLGLDYKIYAWLAR